VLRRDPVHVPYRDTVVCTNPPPSAGGVLVGRALAELGSVPGLPDVPALVAAMVAAERERTPEFLAGLSDAGLTPGLDDSACASANRLGSTTHVSVLDADGWACAVTTSNGEGSGVVVPGTGVHLNNVLGEEDLSPLGFHVEPPGRRLPSMMAPTVVLHDGRGPAGRRLGGQQPDPQRAAAGDRQRGRPRARRAGRRRRTARALRPGRAVRRARDLRRTGWPPPGCP
jgi:gamma-glutamyltranspeptidase/glutathione hydrolase